MKQFEAPCKGCTRRTLYCHNEKTCAAWRMFTMLSERERAIQRESADWAGMTMDHRVRHGYVRGQ